MKTDVYVLETKVDNFKVHRSKTKWNGGHFPCSIFVFNVDITGGKNWKRILFFAVQFLIFMPIAFFLDLLILVIVYALKLAWFLLLKIIDFIFEVLIILFKSLSKTVGRVLSWIIVISFIIATTLFIYTNWNTTKQLFDNLKELFI